MKLLEIAFRRCANLREDNTHASDPFGAIKPVHQQDPDISRTDVKREVLGAVDRKPKSLHTILYTVHDIIEDFLSPRFAGRVGKLTDMFGDETGLMPHGSPHTFDAGDKSLINQIKTVWFKDKDVPIKLHGQDLILTSNAYTLPDVLLGISDAAREVGVALRTKQDPNAHEWIRISTALQSIATTYKQMLLVAPDSICIDKRKRIHALPEHEKAAAKTKAREDYAASHFYDVGQDWVPKARRGATTQFRIEKPKTESFNYKLKSALDMVV